MNNTRYQELEPIGERIDGFLRKWITLRGRDAQGPVAFDIPQHWAERLLEPQPEPSADFVRGWNARGQDLVEQGLWDGKGPVAQSPADVLDDTLGPPNWSERAPEPRKCGHEHSFLNDKCPECHAVSAPYAERAPEPRYQGLVREWREDAKKFRSWEEKTPDDPRAVSKQWTIAYIYLEKCADALERLAAAEPQPDKNCVTLDDGSCVGKNCMHTAAEPRGTTAGEAGQR